MFASFIIDVCVTNMHRWPESLFRYWVNTGQATAGHGILVFRLPVSVDKNRRIIKESLHFLKGQIDHGALLDGVVGDGRPHNMQIISQQSDTRQM